MHNFSLIHIKWSPPLCSKEHCDGEPVGSPLYTSLNGVANWAKIRPHYVPGFEENTTDWTIRVEFSPATAHGLDFVSYLKWDFLSIDRLFVPVTST